MRTSNFISLSMLLFVLATSCKKDIYGCKDATALNHSTEATKDDGSCIFQSTDVVNPQAKMYQYTLNFNTGETYQSYNGIQGDFEMGDVIVTFIEDPNEDGLTDFWVQIPYQNNDGVKFYAEFTNIGTVYLNTTTSNGLSPWTNFHYFNCKSVLIKSSAIAQNPNIDLTSLESIKTTFNL